MAIRKCINFLLICTSVVSFQLNDFESFELHNRSIVQATVKIVEDFYTISSPTFIIFEADGKTQAHQSLIINQILSETQSNVVTYIEDHTRINRYSLRFGSIIFIDSYEAFKYVRQNVKANCNNLYKNCRLIFNQMSDTSFDYTGYYTIVLTTYRSDRIEIITKILIDCWQLNITNVLVLVSIAARSITAAYTYFPYTQFHCGIVAPVPINYYYNGSFCLPTTTLFASKMKNLYNCPLTVATYLIPPYMLFDSLPNGTVRMDGIDGVTFQAVANQMNFTPVVMIPPNLERRGIIYENGTMTGSMSLVRDITLNNHIYNASYASSDETKHCQCFHWCRSCRQFPCSLVHPIISVLLQWFSFRRTCS